MATPEDEGRHEPGDEPLWNESWYFDFAAADGSIGGYVRLGLYPNLGVAWYWAYLVRAGGEPLLAVQHHEVAIPTNRGLEVREEGLWASQHCETPHDHWTIGLEAFAVALDAPEEAYAPELRGDKVALGFDLEWEAIAPVYDYPMGVTRYEQSCRVSGDILIGEEPAIVFDGWGQRDHSWGVRDWWGMGWVWTAGRLGDGTAFHAVKLETDRFDFEPGYVVAPGGELVEASQFKPQYAQEGEHRLPSATAMPLHDLDLTCTPLLLAPVRLDAPDGRWGRFPRGLCRFDAADGRAGYGWTEWNRPG